METKYCRTCDTTKSVDDFYDDKTKPGGKTSNCKDCRKRMHDNWVENNKEYYLAERRLYKRWYRHHHLEEVRRKNLEYRWANIDEIRKKDAERMRKKREGWKKNNLCLSCGKEIGDSWQTYRCIRCADYHLEWDKSRYGFGEFF